MLVYIISLELVSLVGFLLNLILFFQFLTTGKGPLSSFHKLCLFKTIPNLIITSTFAFWASTLSFLGKTYNQIPILENLILSQLVGGFSYFFAPLIQVCMSVNRFSVIYFPFSNNSHVPYTNIAIFSCFLVANIPILLSVLTNCYLVYEPEILIFLPERLEDCGHVMDRSVFFTIGILSLTANGFNLAIFTKLLKDKMGGISEAQKNKRRKKWQSMYIQSVIQDFIQLIDITNYNFTSKIYDAPLWTFLFCCLSFASVYALDGMVMIYFHSNWSVCRKIHSVKKTNFFVSGVQSSGPKSGVVVG
ncbi:hypothetical protein CAEBREN_07014 [Caenorhabditis brenneri]|uniref:7TM GPCR serpentine receptor class x (Srx) domain-containing protein n=1 Tax=Caenorhabditis brenneri TaxID=135651 RepID=G0MRQ1_CAEBE|nr:hypothetical protein CAEBREN_07014 [Caenorhabditis brenneri]